MKSIKIACIIFIVASITWGCAESSSEKKSSGNKKDTKQEQVKTSAQPPVLQTTPSGEVDSHGRKPGDQHYGHNHAPNEAHKQPVQPNTPQATPAGGPDKYGRNPGDAHYGHDHE